MITAEVNTTTNEVLGGFIKKYVDDSNCLELLRFFGWHPYTRFSERAVVHALDLTGGQVNARKALGNLVDKGVVRISTESNVPLYSLTEDESLFRQALNLAKLDWSRCQSAFRQSSPRFAQ